MTGTLAATGEDLKSSASEPIAGEGVLPISIPGVVSERVTANHEALTQEASAAAQQSCLGNAQFPLLTHMDTWLREERSAIHLELQRHHAKMLAAAKECLCSAATSKVCISADEAVTEPLREAATAAPSIPPDVEPSNQFEAEATAVPYKRSVSFLPESSEEGEEVTESSTPKKSLRRSQTEMSSLSVASAVRDSRRETLTFLSEGRAHGNWMYRMVQSKNFELFFSALIAANAIVVAVEVQYDGIGLGNAVEYPRYERSNSQIWPGAGQVFKVLMMIFGCAFAVELCLKLIALRKQFFLQLWNYFDALIVIFWLLDATFAGALPSDAVVIRAARIIRLLRLLRLVRQIQGFDALFVMTTALKGSCSVLLWTASLLLLVNLIFAIGFNLILAPSVQDVSLPLERRHEIFMYFGTCSRSMLTMFELTLGNWIPVARLLQETVSEFWVLFSIGHKVTIGLAVISVINGVFIQETFKAANNDDTIMMRQKNTEIKRGTAKMHNLFQAADSTRGGNVGRKELIQLFLDKEIRLWLAAQQLDVDDPGLLFDMLDKDGNGSLDAQEFVQGIMRLKGPAKEFDVMALMMQLKDFRDDYAHEPPPDLT